MSKEVVKIQCFFFSCMTIMFLKVYLGQPHPVFKENISIGHSFYLEK